MTGEVVTPFRVGRSVDEINLHNQFFNAIIRISKQTDLNSTEKLCYIRLLTFAGKLGYAWPSVERLAVDLGIDRRQIIRVTSRLRDLGYIRIYRRRNAGRSNVYTFLRHAMYLDPSPEYREEELQDTEPTPEEVDEAEIVSAVQSDTDVTPKPQSYVTRMSPTNPGVRDTDVTYDPGVSDMDVAYKETSSEKGSRREEISHGERAASGPSPKEFRGDRLPDPREKKRAPPVDEREEKPRARKDTLPPSPRHMEAAISSALGDSSFETGGDSVAASLRDLPPEQRVAMSRAIVEGVKEADSHTQALIEQRQKVSHEGFRKGERRKRALENLASDGTLNKSRSRKNELLDLETLWRDGLTKREPGLVVGKWGAEERGKVDKLIDKYGAKIVHTGLRYVVHEWDRISQKYFKRSSTLSLGAVSRFHESWFVEAQRWEKHAGIIDEWEAWFKHHPDSSPPSDLIERYESARKELESLGYA